MFREITISGRPFERGRAHGSKAGAEVRTNCAITYARLAACDGLRRDDVHAAREPLDEALAAHFPDLVEEMDGIAAGAGLDRDDVLTLNAFPDIALWNSCTTAIVRTGSGGQPLLFQNNDAFAAYGDTMLVLHVLGGPSHTSVTYAGMVGESGINEHGLAVAGNSLCTRHGGPGVPFIALIRKVLEQPTVAEAIALIQTIPRAAGMAYALVDAHGDAAYLETSADRVGQLQVGDWTAHTNHSLLPELRDAERATEGFLARSRARLEAARDVLGRAAADEGLGQAAKPSRDVLERLARNHAHGRDSVCQHVGSDENPHTAWRTLYSIVVDPVEGSVHLADGLPCEHAFRRVRPVWRAHTAASGTSVKPGGGDE